MNVRRYHIMGNAADGKRVMIEAFTGTRKQARDRSRELRTKALGTWVEYLGTIEKEEK